MRRTYATQTESVRCTATRSCAHESVRHSGREITESLSPPSGAPITVTCVRATSAQAGENIVERTFQGSTTFLDEPFVAEREAEERPGQSREPSHRTNGAVTCGLARVGEHGGSLLREKSSDVDLVCDIERVGVAVGETGGPEIWGPGRKPSHESQRSLQSFPVHGHLQDNGSARKFGRASSDAVDLHVIGVSVAADWIVDS